MKSKLTLLWIVRIVAAAILLQTLYFKFSAKPESVALFTKLGAEPWGRIGSGIMELITGILLLIPSTVFIGALMGAGIMGGAIMAHLTVLGIESQGDGGFLFGLALTVMICCIILLVTYRKQGMMYWNKIFGSHTKLTV